MKKLCLIALLAAALVGCQRPPGPAPAAPRVIALVQLSAVDQNTVAGFRDAMKKLGYEEGKNVTYLPAPPAGSADKLDDIIRGHLARKPDLIVVSSTTATLAVKRLTEESGVPPVVFAPVNDPLGAGIVSDLRHPGGHITGIRLPVGDDLRLQWLARIAPRAKRVYLPYNVDDRSAQTSVQKATEAAARLGLELVKHPIPTNGNTSSAIAAMPARVDAIFLPRDSRLEAGIAEFVAVAEKRHLPISAPSLIQVEAGALFSYGFVHQDIGRQAARLADQILKGVAAGDLPVETGETSLAINLVTARKLGLAIPDDILLQAEHVIRD
ncbi:MAG: ABC transporter substrate-binding protein [Rhodocyclaceae bacterium]|nr:ABC transporter substrate-binding protein [Rhodocyclaceae bacterium]